MYTLNNKIYIYHPLGDSERRDEKNILIVPLI